MVLCVRRPHRAAAALPSGVWVLSRPVSSLCGEARTVDCLSQGDFLIQHRVKCVGIDTWSVEQFGQAEPETHRRLMRAGIGIIEGLNEKVEEVARLSQEGEQVIVNALPLKLTTDWGLDGAPVRAVAFV